MTFPESRHHSSSKSAGRRGTPWEGATGAPLQWKACSRLSTLSDGGQVLSRVCLVLLCLAPSAAGPVLRNWRQPSEGHPFKPLSAPGTCLSIPASRATSSATRRLTAAQQGPAAQTCASLLILPVFVLSSLMRQHSNPANHTFHTARPPSSLHPTVHSHLSLQGLDPVGPRTSPALPVPVRARMFSLPKIPLSLCRTQTQP